jgi:uncharacterized NAD(P)/FAD-binding protein YdhS
VLIREQVNIKAGPGATSNSVAIVGGGASGALTAIHLLSTVDDPSLRVVLHEAGGTLGRGVAYSTTDARHLLNVRARDMSAFPDRPFHLLDWAARTGRAAEPHGFLPRLDYAAYLGDTIADLADQRLEVSRSRVDDVVPVSGGYDVHAGGTSTRATTVVLAYGNLAPRRLAPNGRELPDAPWHLANPWDVDALQALPEAGTTVLVGTGLTAIDTAITLLAGAPGRRVVMTSRHGLLPRAHVPQLSTAWVTSIPTGRLTADRLAQLLDEQVTAAAAQGVDWRAVVDGLRAPTQGLWQRLDLAERRRFLSTYARQWEIRRHRMAPEVAARIDAYRAEGRLTVLGGGVTEVSGAGDGCRVAFGDPTAATLTANGIVNCTGPMTDVSRSDNPLLQALQRRGLATPDPLALGLACTPAGELLDLAGAIVPGLYAVGPPCKGTLYESTAVPEIRAQAAGLAARLHANAHANAHAQARAQV